MNKQVHIVCLDAPAPPDYGGAIDMYYTIQALAEQDINCTLHYFDYKKGRSAGALKQSCSHVLAYERKSFLQALPFSKPHIVTSRINQALIDRLNSDADPIILEGIHCTGILPYLKNKDRKIVVRLHNDEAAYYKHLAKAETNFLKRAYYNLESKHLQHYQASLPVGIGYAALSKSDVSVFKNKYGLNHVFLVPAFVPWQQVTTLPGASLYCLYHGNLSVSENQAAALWLIETVFSNIDVPLVIAGKDIPQHLKKAAASHPHIRLVSNPTDLELAQLIQDAHVHVLPDFNATGIKFKLLHALFCGRFCITNNCEIDSSKTVAFAETPQVYMRFIKSFMQQEFHAAAITEREAILHPFNNDKNVTLLTACLW